VTGRGVGIGVGIRVRSTVGKAFGIGVGIGVGIAVGIGVGIGVNWDGGVNCIFKHSALYVSRALQPFASLHGDVHVSFVCEGKSDSYYTM
jgi:hypothetical protein